MKKILSFISVLIVMISCHQTKENPFFSMFETPYGVPPFDQIKTEYYEPAFEEGIKQQNAEIKAIVENPESASFENTIVALDNSGALLEQVSLVFFALDGSNTDSVMQKIATNVSPKLSEHGDNIYLNEKLFTRIKAVHDQNVKNSTILNVGQKRLLDKYYKRFVRSGILLNELEKARLREINKELTMLSLSFGQNLLAETNNYKLIIDNQSDLAGLPEGIISAAAATAKSNGLEDKWLFTLQKPSWIPFLQYAENRTLREKLYKAMYMRCDNNNEFDNKEIINKMVNLRLERANLLGYKTHADFVLDETMAKTPENVNKLLNEVWKYALPQAKKEAEELQQLINKGGVKFKLQSWDWWFYAEKLRKARYNLDEESLRPYFSLENVRNGIFTVANKLYGLNFEVLNNIAVYRSDVTVFKVTDADGSYIGIIYLDYFPHEGKRGGAWMGNFSEQYVKQGKDIRPVIYNVGNFTKPAGEMPALLSPDEVETMFHEFGHALHGLLSTCNYKGVSGTNVARDFVELPSQILEHWAFHPDVLPLYAKHWKTGEIIPEELVKKLKKANTFNQGFMTTELVAAMLLDMNWHTITEKQNINVRSFEKGVLDKIGLIPEIIVRYRSPYFAHIFDGGYSAGYYSYLWSEVLDADAFELFEEKGVFDANIAKSFRDNVLSKGDGEDPMVLYKRFRGTDPNPIYLLKNRGFVE